MLVCTSVATDVDFLEEIGTLYDLLIYLLDNSMIIIISVQTQIDFFKAITVLRIIISNLKTDITDQSEEQKKKIFAKQENVLSNAEMLLKKRGELIDQFSKNNIISKDEKFHDDAKKSEESISEKSEQKSDQSIPKWVQVSKDRFNFIKFIINMNKDLATMIDNKRLFGRNYWGEIFNGPIGEESASRGEGLKILTPNQMLSRLPISLVQLKAGNKSEKLKSEIRQL